MPISNTVPQNYKFTGKERDPESGNDYFGARYYASNLGRFLTPDWAARPAAVPYAVFGDPQTLNLYSYVENGPVNRVDADGHGEDCGHGGDICDAEWKWEQSNAGTLPAQTKDKQDTHDQAKNAATAQNQKPSSLSVVFADKVKTDPSKGTYGIKVSVTYQINDQNGKPMTSQKMAPEERFWGVVPNGDPPKFGDPKGKFKQGFATTKYADSNGRFVDSPVGATMDRPSTATLNQEIRIRIGDETFPVTTYFR